MRAYTYVCFAPSSCVVDFGTSITLKPLLLSNLYAQSADEVTWCRTIIDMPPVVPFSGELNQCATSILYSKLDVDVVGVQCQSDASDS